ncbi:MAG: exosortase C-terminal domain/associated protein EpsI [Vicinamibacterales bacterium]
MSVVTRLVVVAALLGAAAVALSAAGRREETPARALLSGFPLSVDGWRGTEAEPLDLDTMRVLGVDDYVLRSYSGDAGLVGLYVGYYGSQRQGDTIHSPMNCLPGAGWVPAEAGRAQLRTPDGSVEVNRYLIQKGEDRQVALYWYQGRGRTVASEYWSKAYLVWDAARRRRTDGALVRVLSPVGRDEDVAVAEARALEFAALIYPRLAPYIPE